MGSFCIIGKIHLIISIHKRIKGVKTSKISRGADLNRELKVDNPGGARIKLQLLFFLDHAIILQGHDALRASSMAADSREATARESLILANLAIYRPSSSATGTFGRRPRGTFGLDFVRHD